MSFVSSLRSQSIRVSFVGLIIDEYSEISLPFSTGWRHGWSESIVSTVRFDLRNLHQVRASALQAMRQSQLACFLVYSRWRRVNVEAWIFNNNFRWTIPTTNSRALPWKAIILLECSLYAVEQICKTSNVWPMIWSCTVSFDLVSNLLFCSPDDMSICRCRWMWSRKWMWLLLCDEIS